MKARWICLEWIRFAGGARPRDGQGARLSHFFWNNLWMFQQYLMFISKIFHCILSHLEKFFWKFLNPSSTAKITFLWPCKYWNFSKHLKPSQIRANHLCYICAGELLIMKTESDCTKWNSWKVSSKNSIYYFL